MAFPAVCRKSIRKQRKDFSVPFEPITADTEIAPIVRREKTKAVMESAPKPVIDTPKTENETMKPSFRMLDGTAVLEEDGFYMELAVEITNASEIKEKIDLFYSAFEKFRAIGRPS